MNNQREQQLSKLNLETASVPWRELQRFFANGTAVAIHPSLNLLAVAADVAVDNAAQVEAWMQQGMFNKVTAEQSLQWLNDDQLVWTVVVKPWVLVQIRTDGDDHRANV